MEKALNGSDIYCTTTTLMTLADAQSVITGNIDPLEYPAFKLQSPNWYNFPKNIDAVRKILNSIGATINTTTMKKNLNYLEIWKATIGSAPSHTANIIHNAVSITDIIPVNPTHLHKLVLSKPNSKSRGIKNLPNFAKSPFKIKGGEKRSLDFKQEIKLITKTVNNDPNAYKYGLHGNWLAYLKGAMGKHYEAYNTAVGCSDGSAKTRIYILHRRHCARKG